MKDNIAIFSDEEELEKALISDIFSPFVYLIKGYKMYIVENPLFDPILRENEYNVQYYKNVVAWLFSLDVGEVIISDLSDHFLVQEMNSAGISVFLNRGTVRDIALRSVLSYVEK